MTKGSLSLLSNMLLVLVFLSNRLLNRRIDSHQDIIQVLFIEHCRRGALAKRCTGHSHRPAVAKRCTGHCHRPAVAKRCTEPWISGLAAQHSCQSPIQDCTILLPITHPRLHTTAANHPSKTAQYCCQSPIQDCTMLLSITRPRPVERKTLKAQ